MISNGVIWKTKKITNYNTQITKHAKRAKQITIYNIQYTTFETLYYLTGLNLVGYIVFLFIVYLNLYIVCNLEFVYCNLRWL